MRALWGLTLLGLASASAAAPARVDYGVAPVLDQGSLAALAVELRFRGDVDGETLLHLPGEWAGTGKLWQAVSDL